MGSAATIDRIRGKQGQLLVRPALDEQRNVVADHALIKVHIGIFDDGCDQAHGQLRGLAHEEPHEMAPAVGAQATDSLRKVQGLIRVGLPPS